MAKILFGLGFEAISGTFGGATFQKWRSLNIVRGKPVPSNPMTERQTRIRSIVSTISRAWRDVLTAGQRRAWEQFAEIFPWFDVFGKSMSLRGISLFLKMNTVLLDHNRAMQITPPPDVDPPELTDAVLDPGGEGGINLEISQMTPGIVTAQEPFIDIFVAGGFTSFTQSAVAPTFAVDIESLCLPAGRKHQKSDFRHVLYVDDVPIVEPPATSLISVMPPDDHTRNVVLRLQRYNRYGRYSVPILFDGIWTGG